MRPSLSRILGLGSAAILVVVLLSGCSHSLGYAGSHPGRFTCRGKVAVTIAIAGQINAGFSGGNLGSISANGDCGHEFTIEQGQAGPPPVPGPATIDGTEPTPAPAPAPAPATPSPGTTPGHTPSTFRGGTIIHADY